MNVSHLNRRQMLGTIAVTGSLASAGIGFGGARAASNDWPAMLVDPRIPLRQRNWVLAQLQESQLPIRDLQIELVRQWRDSLKAQLVAAGAARFLTRMDMALILRGLLREERAIVTSTRCAGALHLTYAELPRQKLKTTETNNG